MPLKIGFDMDGVLADLSHAYHGVEADVLDSAPDRPHGQPERRRTPDHEEEEAPEAAVRPGARRRQDKVWNAIRAIPNFWESLKPLEEGAVARIAGMMLRHSWEVFFITQRPATDGDTVQRQTQRWLVAQGFDLPSVLVIAGSRGAAAAALKLDYHVDDNTRNCLDVMAAARSKVILVVGGSDQTIAMARKMRMATVSSIGQCLDLLDQVSEAQSNPTLLERLATLVGWN